MVDWEQIEMISDGFSPEFMEIFREFAAEVPALLNDLERAKEDGDLDAVRRVAHQIKGSAANFGFVGLSRQAAAVEATAKTGSWNGIPEGLVAAQAAYSAALEALKQQKQVHLT